MGHDEHAVAFDESARDNRENDAERPGRRFEAGVSEEAIDEFVTPYAEWPRSLTFTKLVKLPCQLLKNWQSYLASYGDVRFCASPLSASSRPAMRSR